MSGAYLFTLLSISEMSVAEGRGSGYLKIDLNRLSNARKASYYRTKTVHSPLFSRKIERSPSQPLIITDFKCTEGAGVGGREARKIEV